MGRFWIEDSFIREGIQKHKLQPLAALVYITLCNHANKQGHTFIGTRRVAELLNSSKSAVARAIKQLEAVPLVGHRTAGLSHLTVLTVPLTGKSVPLVGQKEVSKEVYKEAPKTITKTIRGIEYRFAQ